MYAIVFLISSLIVSLQGFGFYNIGYGFRFSSTFSKQNLTLGREKWIEQPLDHFDKNEKRTWMMRYFEFFDFWKPNCTIYLYIGGESGSGGKLNILGPTYINDLVNETNGIMFGTEHRYYGKSVPMNYTDTKNLKYLSSEQALADISYLLKTLRSSPKFKTSTASKVVVIGGSYAGNLAAWMRVLYPDLVDAAIASSAPVLAKKDFYEYNEKVSDDFMRYGTNGCYDKIVEIFKRIDDLLKTPEGIKQLKAEENICEDIDMTKKENIYVFFGYKVDIYQLIAQYGDEASIKKNCKKIMNTSSIESFEVENGERLYNFWREETGCNHFDFNDMIQSLKTSKFLPWIYQTCTEFGYFQSTDSDKQPFTRNMRVEFDYKTCTELFGAEFDEHRIDKGIEYTNKLYGGVTPNVTNVVFVNGDMDPWSRLGVLKNLSNDAPAVLIPRLSHCKDLFPSEDQDSEELIQARKFVKTSIKKWIGFMDNTS